MSSVNSNCLSFSRKFMSFSSHHHHPPLLKLPPPHHQVQFFLSFTIFSSCFISYKLQWNLLFLSDLERVTEVTTKHLGLTQACQ